MSRTKRHPGPSAAASDLSRRRFLEQAAVAGGAVALGGCSSEGGTWEETAQSEGRELPWVKDPTSFIEHPTNLETRLERVTGFLTPNDLFFVRNHAPTPRVDVDTWRLQVDGDGVSESLSLSYEDLLGFPSQTTVAYLECAGNWRRFYESLVGEVASGGQWGTGAVGCATWTGVSLASVLERAGLRDGAVDVNLIGLDEGAFERPMSVEKAVASDTLLALTMNGSPLPPDHGFPVRGVVPGWVGSNSVKWLSRIVVSTEKQWVRNNTTSYVLVGDAWPADQYAPADGGPITEQNVKSALALAWPARVAAEPRRLRGFAHAPSGIRSVEWRVDDGPWQTARLIGPQVDGAWTRFELTWDATPGSHQVRTRATDRRGQTQPDRVEPNAKGYLLNVPLPHPIDVV